MNILEVLDQEKLELDKIINEKMKNLDPLDYEAFNALSREFDMSSFRVQCAQKTHEINIVKDQVIAYEKEKMEEVSSV